MRFKVDENLHEEIAAALRAEGHDERLFTKRGSVDIATAILVEYAKESSEPSSLLTWTSVISENIHRNSIQG